MLLGLSSLELGRLRVSVGYGTHKKGRPLSPVEVGQLLRRALDGGATLDDCAKEIQLKGTGHIGRFMKILDLPYDVLHLVDWGTGKSFIGFSVAVELVKIPSEDDIRIVAQSIIAEGLTSREVRQIGQLRKRSRRTIQECIGEIVGMRRTITKKYVFIGAVNEKGIQDALNDVGQLQRDALIKMALEDFGLQRMSGRLGSQFFTLVGDEKSETLVEDIGRDKLESMVRNFLLEHLSSEHA